MHIKPVTPAGRLQFFVVGMYAEQTVANELARELSVCEIRRFQDGKSIVTK